MDLFYLARFFPERDLSATNQFRYFKAEVNEKENRRHPQKIEQV
jgi:hypothetical protein